jgi:phosphoglycolate phosphatase
VVKKLVVYDFDGTLVDTAPVVTELLNQLRKELGLDPLPAQDFVPWLSLGGVDLIANSLSITDAVLIKKYLDEFRSRYAQVPGNRSPLYNNALISLQLLTNAGYEIALCSNKPRTLVDKIISGLNIQRYFPVIIAGGDLPNKKPDPQMLLECIIRSGGTVEHSILVGDSTVDQQTARNAGVRFAFYSNGYDDGVTPSSVDMVSDDHLELYKKILFHE